jgi:hypothetical protein
LNPDPHSEGGVKFKNAGQKNQPQLKENTEAKLLNWPEFPSGSPIPDTDPKHKIQQKMYRKHQCRYWESGSTS